MGEAGEPAVDPQCIALLKESIQQLEEPMQEESNYIFTVLGASVSLSRLKFVRFSDWNLYRSCKFLLYGLI